MIKIMFYFFGVFWTLSGLTFGKVAVAEESAFKLSIAKYTGEHFPILNTIQYWSGSVIYSMGGTESLSRDCVLKIAGDEVSPKGMELPCIVEKMSKRPGIFKRTLNLVRLLEVQRTSYTFSLPRGDAKTLVDYLMLRQHEAGGIEEAPLVFNLPEEGPVVDPFAMELNRYDRRNDSYAMFSKTVQTSMDGESPITSEKLSVGRIAFELTRDRDLKGKRSNYYSYWSMFFEPVKTRE